MVKLFDCWIIIYWTDIIRTTSYNKTLIIGTYLELCILIFIFWQKCWFHKYGYSTKLSIICDHEIIYCINLKTEQFFLYSMVYSVRITNSVFYIRYLVFWMMRWPLSAHLILNFIPKKLIDYLIWLNSFLIVSLNNFNQIYLKMY